MYLELCDQLQKELAAEADPFDWFLQQDGQVYREVKNRLTYESRLGDLHFYVKRHLGCGWKEVLKEWYRLRSPVVSARTEWEGAEKLSAAGVRVPRILGKGERGRYPHAVESFVVLEALDNCDSLEHFKHGWHDYTGTRWVQLKRALLDKVAGAAKIMHGSGINHRDFYLNHFLINRDAVANWQPGDNLELALIDLHRVQQRASVPPRWLLKDLRSLFFSTMDVGLTSADCARFLRTYLGDDWKHQIRTNRKFWKKTCQLALEMYTDWHKRSPTLPRLLQS